MTDFPAAPSARTSEWPVDLTPAGSADFIPPVQEAVDCKGKMVMVISVDGVNSPAVTKEAIAMSFNARLMTHMPSMQD